MVSDSSKFLVLGILRDGKENIAVDHKLLAISCYVQSRFIDIIKPCVLSRILLDID